MGMLRAMIRAPSCLLGLLLALVPVSQAVADCTDPPGPGVTWRRCVFDRLEFQNVNLTGAELRDASFRSEEHTSELQSLMRISYAVFCLKKTKQKTIR